MNNKKHPPEVVNFNKLLPAEMVKQKYPKLRGPERASGLSVKLAVEAFFGPDVLARCTVACCRSLPGLPEEQLQNLKQFIWVAVTPDDLYIAYRTHSRSRSD